MLTAPEEEAGLPRVQEETIAGSRMRVNELPLWAHLDMCHLGERKQKSAESMMGAFLVGAALPVLG